MHDTGTARPYQMHQSPAPWRWVVCLSLAAAFATTTLAATPSASCAKGAGLAVLVDQDALYLDRPSRRESMGESLLISLLATAATGGAYWIALAPGSHPEDIVPARPTTPADLQPPDVARALAQALSETPASGNFDLLVATQQGNEVDAALDRTGCSRIVVLNALYRLEHVKHGVQLAFVTRLLDVSTQTYQRSTIAALEYRSPILPYTGADDTASFEHWLTEQVAIVRLTLREALDETARMASRQLQPAEDAASSAELGKDRARVLCDDCRKTDRVILRTPTRAWIQPVDNPRVLRSLAFGA
jgi:hypothetical protein